MKKKLLLLIAVLAISFTPRTFAQHPSDVDFTILMDESVEGQFYPSLAIWNSAQEDQSDLFFSFYLVAPKAGDVVRITVEGTSINDETVIQRVAEEKGEMYIHDCVIKWDYDKLAKIEQTSSVNLTCILEINGKEIDRRNQVVRCRPVNECVFGMILEDEWVSTDEMFALYVNEDYPQIDKILGEILAVNRERQFIDYQGDGIDVINQLYWVWEYFSEKGTRYSNVVSSSNSSDILGVQYVRFIDQVINNVQANCVDGSALLASIYRKIGFDVYLVSVPGHMYLAVYSPHPTSLNDAEYYGEITSDRGGLILIETTLMGSVNSANDSFGQAIMMINVEQAEYKMENEDFALISIAEARAEGIVPISRPYNQ